MSGSFEVYDIQFHEDDRAQRLLDCFNWAVMPGQINVSHVKSTEHIVAWHKHVEQTDYWVCVQGSFKVGLAKEWEMGKSAWWRYLSDKRQEVLVIRPGLFHGYKALEPNSILMYYTDRKYDPSDEIRVPVGYFEENWETENK
jgi:dTDP-4-dehydrorhamnose 3,5-epimerase-like enzyme